MEGYLGYAGAATVGAVISGKWAMELGLSQFRQLLWAIAGLFFPPIVLLVLYLRMLYSRERAGQPGSAWWTSQGAEKST